jgi:murein DD-endopeptidase MepM/ murein hydrolase activator NlpD
MSGVGGRPGGVAVSIEIILIQTLSEGVFSNDGDRGYGKWVDVRHGNGFTTRYGHLSRIWYNPGRVLNAGEELGLSGNTGRSTGPHLHFEVRWNGVPINPR